jgi:hypothetical protein
VVPKTNLRFLGATAKTKIPMMAAQSAASNQNAIGPLGLGAAGATGTIFAREDASRLAGTVTVNDVLVPPGNCGSAVLTSKLAPVPVPGVHMTSVFGLKFVPVTVSVTFAAVVAVVGEIDVSVGIGASTLKFSEFWTPPETLTAATPEAATADAGTLTVICVALAEAGVNAVVPKFTIGPAGKPAPFNVSVKPADPAAVLVGESPVSAEAGIPGNCKSQSPRP